VAAGSAGSASAAEPDGTGSALAAAPAGTGSAVAEGQGSAAVEPPPAGSAAEPAGGSGQPPAEVAAGPGADTEMDPITADDPAPASARPSGDEDEAANAPRTADEVEKHAREVEKRASTGPVLAATLQGAVQLIQDGKHDLAMASLRALWKKTPASAYIPFLLGNLYYDQRWWTVAMDHYALAIKKNTQYRSNPTLNRNVIRMLASDKTSRKAQGFLRFTVGRSSLPYLRTAAQRDPSSQVRKTASWLLRAI
jgi:TolA-binding protein